MAKESQAIKAYQSIRASIFDGTLFQGYPITEVELSEKLHMSRTPVREALSRLISQGLLLSIPRKGVVVRQFSNGEIVMAYEYLEAIEGKMAESLAENASVLCFDNAWRCVGEMEKALSQNDAEAWAIADDALHDELRDLCQNPFLVEGLKRMYGQIYYIRMLYARLLLDKQKSTDEHRQTLLLISQGESQQARQCAEAHLRRVRNEVSRLP